MLDVDGGNDIDSGVQQFFDVRQRLAFLTPGTFVWASSSITATAGCDAERRPNRAQ